MKKDIFGLTIEKLTEEFGAVGLRPFRAKQVYQWLYKKCVFDFDAMHNISKADREALRDRFTLLPENTRIARELNSKDGLTSKMLLEFADGNFAETVLMRHDYGCSVCVSSQAGCDMSCAFCASGLTGCSRNLTAAEILFQVYLFNKRLLAENKSVGRIVVMGSGEPMLNFEEVIGAFDFLHRQDTSHISYRSMTVSTCGIIPGIRKLQEQGKPINLAISLHAVDNDLRTSLMPVNRAYPFVDVLSAAEAYARSSGRQVTYEYILLKGINDSTEDAESLSYFLRHKLASVNLIPANPVPEKGLMRPDQKTCAAFLQILHKNKINATIRKEMGRDIEAACGQLRAAFAEGQEIQ